MSNKSSIRSSGDSILLSKWWHGARLEFDVVNCIVISRHSRRFEHVRVLSNNRFPMCILLQIRCHVTCSTHVSLHGDHVCCRLDQHEPSLTPLALIMLNLLNATQFNPGYRFCGQGMKHLCATMLTTVYLHHTGLPIDSRIGGLQPVYSQHNIMVQWWQNSAINSAMQCIAVLRLYNQRYTTCP